MGYFQDNFVDLTRGEGNHKENREKRKDKMKNLIPSYDPKLTRKFSWVWVLQKHAFSQKCFATNVLTDPFGEGIAVLVFDIQKESCHFWRRGGDGWWEHGLPPAHVSTEEEGTEKEGGCGHF